MTANTNPGDFNVEFNGAFTDQSLPSLTVASQTGTLPTSLLDDGSVWNGTRTGGVDPGIAPVSDLGNGIIASTGIMSSGPAGGVFNPLTLKTTNTGKSSFYPDTQYTFIQYPSRSGHGDQPEPRHERRSADPRGDHGSAGTGVD